MLLGRWAITASLKIIVCHGIVWNCSPAVGYITVYSPRLGALFYLTTYANLGKGGRVNAPLQNFFLPKNSFLLATELKRGK